MTLTDFERDQAVLLNGIINPLREALDTTDTERRVELFAKANDSLDSLQSRTEQRLLAIIRNGRR